MIIARAVKLDKIDRFTRLFPHFLGSREICILKGTCSILNGNEPPYVKSGFIPLFCIDGDGSFRVIGRTIERRLLPPLLWDLSGRNICAMESIVDKVAGVVEPAIEAEGYLLVDLEFIGGSSGGTLRFFIDKPEGGVSLDDCEQVSRLVSPLLDVENIIESRYFLEVSSPGINRRIRKKNDFEKYVGAKVKIHLRSPQEGRKKITGTIEGVENGDVIVGEETAAKHMRVALANILRANLQVL